MSSEYKDFMQAASIDWSTPTKRTVDGLMEAIHYFASLQRNRAYKNMDFDHQRNTVKITHHIQTAFQTILTEAYHYFITYTRKYLEHGDRKFERAKSMRGAWLSIYNRIVERAVLENSSGQFKDKCCIVMVMEDKTVWYLNPASLKKFAFEYETNIQHYYSVPVSKTEIVLPNDPFNPSSPPILSTSKQ